MIFFLCVGVMYSGEYDACDVTLSVYPHRDSFKTKQPLLYTQMIQSCTEASYQ